MTVSAISSHVGQTGPVSYANASWGYHSFNTVYNDPFGMANLLVHNDRLTVPVAGLYLCLWNAEFTASATGVRGMRIVKNAADVLIVKVTANTGAGDAWLDQVACAVPLAAGDYIGTELYQAGGGPLNALGGGKEVCGLVVTLLQ